MFFQTKYATKKLTPTLQFMVHFIHAVREFNKNRDLHKDFLKNVWLVIHTNLCSRQNKVFFIYFERGRKTSRLGNSF